MNTAKDLARYVLPTYARFPVAPVRGEGTLLWDEGGNRYLDFCAGLATCTLDRVGLAVQPWALAEMLTTPVPLPSEHAP